MYREHSDNRRALTHTSHSGRCCQRIYPPSHYRPIYQHYPRFSKQKEALKIYEMQIYSLHGLTHSIQKTNIFFLLFLSILSISSIAIIKLTFPSAHNIFLLISPLLLILCILWRQNIFLCLRIYHIRKKVIEKHREKNSFFLKHLEFFQDIIPPRSLILPSTLACIIFTFFFAIALFKFLIEKNISPSIILLIYSGISFLLLLSVIIHSMSEKNINRIY